MPIRARIVLVGLFFATVAGLIVYGTAAYLRQNPPNVNFVAGHQTGQPVNITVQTVGAIGYGQHPTWVSYLIQDRAGKWVHSTQWQLPAHTRINVTLEEYDSGSPLRNPALDLVQGTANGNYLLNGKPVSLVNGAQGNGIAHTFTVPVLGISVPLAGVNGSGKTFCNQPAPCPLSAEHNTINFSFTTPGAGQYQWQCFIPCGLSYLDGNGGPMQTVGFMDGFLKVLA